MKIHLKFNKIVLVFFIIIFLALCISSYWLFPYKYNAVYFTSKSYSSLSNKELKSNRILAITSLANLKSQVHSLNYKVGILVDESVLKNSNSNSILNLNKWLLKQTNYPIIVVGYGNPTYVFYKKLVFINKSNTPPFSEEKFNQFKSEKGFSFAYICKDGKIYGKGYKGKINIDKIVQIIRKSLKNEENAKSIVEGEN